MNNNKVKLDKPVFLISSILVGGMILSAFLFPDQMNDAMQSALHGLLSRFGFIYTWAGMASLIGCLYFAFSKYGKIKFGSAEEKPEFGGFTWAATLFTAGIAVAILYWAPIEWTFYYREPALGVEASTWEAAEWAMAYDFFHWGFIPWALYSISALAIGYSYFTRKQPVMKVSETCREVIGKHADGILGKVFDTLFIFAIVMGATTEIGIAAPLITTTICSLFHVEPTLTHSYIVLGATAILFTLAACFGLKKGLARLGNCNYILAIAIIAFVFIFGPTVFILKMATTSTGLLFDQYIRMMTWMDPITRSGFVESWTQFYWAWWLSFGLLLGLLIARMSRGRTVRFVLLGSIGFGSLGCGVFFWTMGGFTMDLHFSGALDLIATIDAKGAYAAIVDCLKQLPVGSLLILLYAVCGVLFLSTTFDATATSLAAVSQKNLEIGKDPDPRIVIYWCVVLVLVPAGILSMEGPFELLQATVVVGSLPIVFIILIEVISFVKMVKHDEAT